MKRLMALFMCASLILLFCGCTSLFMKKDTLIELKVSSESSDNSTVASNVTIDQYDLLFHGILLAYDQNSNISILTQTEISSSNMYSSKLLSYQNGTFYNLFSSDTEFSEARIDPNTHDIYFKQRDSQTDTSALYWANIQGDTKVRLCEDVYDNYLAWDFTAESNLVYVDKDNRIMLGTKDGQTAVFTLDKTYAVKEITYSAEANMLLLIASTSQTSNILYRIDLNTDPALSAIDVNVNDFTFSEKTGAAAYTKTTSGGDDQLYIYNYQSYLREYLCSGYIEKLSFSPDGTYIAFATKATSEIPTQSIWIIRHDASIPIQITANTLLNSDIVWLNNGSGIIFTTSDASDVQTGVQTEYNTYYLQFSFENTESDAVGEK